MISLVLVQQLLLSVEDLKEIGVPMGPRKKLMSHITAQNKILDVHTYMYIHVYLTHCIILLLLATNGQNSKLSI